MAPGEWAAMYLSVNPVEAKKSMRQTVRVHQPKVQPEALPGFWDWSQMGVTTGIKDQGQCGPSERHRRHRAHAPPPDSQ
jgi:hypothetical protein